MTIKNDKNDIRLTGRQKKGLISILFSNGKKRMNHMLLQQVQNGMKSILIMIGQMNLLCIPSYLLSTRHSKQWL